MRTNITSKSVKCGLRDYNAFKNSNAYLATTVNVYNQTTDDTLEWIASFSAVGEGSTYVFDEDLRVICHKDILGTFDGIKVKTIDEAMPILNRKYYNAALFKMAVMDAVKNLVPRKFVLHMVENYDVICKAHPVLKHGRLIGLIVKAWVEDRSNTTKQKRLTYIIQGQ